MPSEHPSGTALARLADLLAEASSGDRPSPRELAELLWLAGHMEGPREPEPDPGPDAGAAGQRGDDRTPSTEPPPLPPPRDDTPPPAPGERRPEPPRAPLHLPAPAGTATARHASLLAPAPPMLRHPLALQRALRPLKRHADAPLGQELDERATAERIARLGGDPDAWLPVMRPARERWLSLRLVHDTGPTMPVWRPLVRELHTALAQSGVFRTVTLHPAGPDGSVPADAAHTPADGRTVVLLVSDCMGPQWRKGPAADLWYATLRRWAHRMPLAVVQPLPEHLWRDTALPTTPGHLSAPGPAAPTATLAFAPYDDTAEETPTEGTLFLPVLEPDPHWLANWAALTAGSGGTRYPAAVARLDGTPPLAAPDRTDLTLLSPEELVLRFRATASPQAFRLAGHLALGRPDLPVMRLVQAALEPDPRPQHLAEIILSGMLTAVPGPPGSYAFRPGVRDLLLRGLPRTARAHTTELLERVGALIDTRAGRAPGEFLASTPAEHGTASGAEGEAFASVSEESVRRLTGTAPDPVAPGDRYRLLRPEHPGGSVWQAYDTRTDRQVVLRLCPQPVTPERREAFLRHARALARIDDPNVVAVLDHGVRDGVPYVTTENPDGITLGALALGYPGGLRLPALLTVSIGNQLARALLALHRAYVAHGAVDLTRVVLLPDGTVKLPLPDLAEEPGPEAFVRDLRALGEMLWQLSSGAPLRPGTRVTADRLSALPSALRGLYSAALADTLSGSLTRQREGAARLQRRPLLDLARADHVPLRYVLFGRPAVTRGDGRPVATGSPRERAMLCMLLLSHGRKVPHAKLVDGIWGTEAPPRATELLGTYASRLRNALGPGVLASLPDGYALHTSTDHVDLVECQHLVARAEAARAAGDAERARGHLTAALVLWNGPALEGVSGPAAQTARTRLLQLRLTLSRRRAELDLDLDEVDRAAADLAELVREHPSREDFRRLYLIALRRQGRLEEALEVFEEYELSGGRSPELLALGQELREEYGGPPDEDGVAAPDEDLRTEPDDLPAGSFPTEEDLPSLLAQDEESRDERPLPRDEVPDSLFPDAWRWAEFEFADGTEYVESHQPVVTRAIRRWATESGWGSELSPLVRRRTGFSLLTTATLFRIVRNRFPELLAELDGVRLFVTYRSEPEPGRFEHDLRAQGITDAVQGLILVEPGLAGELEETRPVIAYHRTDVAETGPEVGGLPVFTARGCAIWRATGPAEAAGMSDLVRGQVADRLRDLTLHYPPTSAGQAHTALQEALAEFSVSGHEVYWDVSLTSNFPPPPALPRRSGTPAARALRTAQAVIFGFDGTLTRLYTEDSRAETLRDLARLLAEERSPDDALAGRALLPPGAGVVSQGHRPHPLDLLRAFGDGPHAPALHNRLTAAERVAARAALPSPNAALVVRTLADKGMRLAVVTDTAPHIAAGFLERHGLLDSFDGGVHGRDSGRTPLPPDPDTVERAVARLGVPPAACLVIGTTAAEQEAARAAGTSYLSKALRPLLDAAREL